MEDELKPNDAEERTTVELEERPGRELEDATVELEDCLPTELEDSGVEPPSPAMTMSPAFGTASKYT